MRLSRRSLLSSAGALVGLAAAGASSDAQSSSSTNSIDTVVIGAGLSDLIAALELRKKGKRVVVLEAKDRIGGRKVNRNVVGNGVIDLGGQWGGKIHVRLKDLTE